MDKLKQPKKLSNKKLTESIGYLQMNDKILLDYIVKEGYSEEYGARNIKRFIKNEVAPVVAEALLEQKLPKKQGDLYTPKIVDGKLTIVNIETEPRNQAAG